jgi:hypothetical protein
MRAIVEASRAAAQAIRDRVNAANGYPRCERLSGGITQIGGGRHVDSCPCTVATSPHPACLLATRSDADVHPLKDGSFAIQVQEGKAASFAALSAAEKARIVTVNESQRTK